MLQQRPGNRRLDRQTHHALGLGQLTTDHLGQLIGVTQQRLGMAHQYPAGVGQGGATPVPVKQAMPQLQLQLKNPFADRRLGDI
ncbi:hypothetical protein LBMAG30_18630 [Comamonadaceae bacterium]|nr:hypothetical protein LBMAG30_18630 [Comamonadaceae bacterium]